MAFGLFPALKRFFRRRHRRPRFNANIEIPPYFTLPSLHCMRLQFARTVRRLGAGAGHSLGYAIFSARQHKLLGLLLGSSDSDLVEKDL